MSKVTLKIIVVGNGNVGKTALSTRFTTGGFRESYIYTIGANFLIKTIDLDDVKVKLTLWDTAGQERYGRLLPKFFQNSDGAIIVYDQLDKTSFLAIDAWVDKINRFAGEIPLVLVSNKADLYDSVITLGEGITKAAYHSASFIETSAKENFLVDETFIEISRRCMGKSSENLMDKHERIKKITTVEVQIDDEIPSSKVMTMPVPTVDLSSPIAEESTQESVIEHESEEPPIEKPQELEPDKPEIKASLFDIPTIPTVPTISKTPETPEISETPETPDDPTPIISNDEPIITAQPADLPEVFDDAVSDSEDEQLDHYDDLSDTESSPVEASPVDPLDMKESLTNELTEETAEISPPKDELSEELVNDGGLDEYEELEPEISENNGIPDVVSKDQWPQIKQRVESVSMFIDEEPPIEPQTQIEDKEENYTDKITDKVQPQKEEPTHEDVKTENLQLNNLDLTDIPSPLTPEPIASIDKEPQTKSEMTTPFSAVIDDPSSMDSLSTERPIKTPKLKIDYFDSETQSSLTFYRDEIASKVVNSINQPPENEAILDWLQIIDELSEDTDHTSKSEEANLLKNDSKQLKRKIPLHLLRSPPKIDKEPVNDVSEDETY